MVAGLIGYKRGMTQIFKGDTVIPVTIIEFLTNVVTQVKQYNNISNVVQISTGFRKSKDESKVNYLKKQLSGRSLIVKEFSCCSDDNHFRGEHLPIDVFKETKFVDVVGYSKGKGFTGVIKRHNFSTQPASHGNSKTHRAPGSIGQCQTPGKVFKGKKMAGRMGNSRVNIKNLQVVDIDYTRNIIFVFGSVPGATNSFLIVKKSTRG